MKDGGHAPSVLFDHTGKGSTRHPFKPALRSGFRDGVRCADQRVLFAVDVALLGRMYFTPVLIPKWWHRGGLEGAQKQS